MAPIAREKRLNILVTEAEQQMLQALADRDGITASDYVRMFIRRAHAEAFGEQPTKPRKAKR
jgi:hypothetical protein